MAVAEITKKFCATPRLLGSQSKVSTGVITFFTTAFVLLLLLLLLWLLLAVLGVMVAEVLALCRGTQEDGSQPLREEHNQTRLANFIEPHP